MMSLDLLDLFDFSNFVLVLGLSMQTKQRHYLNFLDATDCSYALLNVFQNCSNFPHSLQKSKYAPTIQNVKMFSRCSHKDTTAFQKQKIHNREQFQMCSKQLPREIQKTAGFEFSLK